jgi:ribosome-associated protein
MPTWRPVPKQSEQPEARAVAIAAARAAADKKASDIRILEVRELLVITDYFVICSGVTDRQVRTILQEVAKVLADLGLKPVRREGERDLRWVLLDFGDVVVHIFTQAERDFYELERLWADAPVVEWEEEARAASRRS